MCIKILDKGYDCPWKYSYVSTTEELFKCLNYFSTLKHRWVFRGTPQNFGFKLIPSIDRSPFDRLASREEKITVERKAIEIYRANIRLFSHPDFENLLLDDITTLMLMQHYGAPTRLLDWSLSPLIAAFFASFSPNKKDEKEDGIIWCFDYDRYIDMGSCQWNIFTEMGKGDNFDNKLTPAFQSTYANKWFICQFLYKYKFPRIITQDGLFSFISQFNIDHAVAIKELLEGDEYQHVIIIKNSIKNELLNMLNRTYHIWYGYIYPDNVGIALGTMNQLKDEYK